MCMLPFTYTLATNTHTHTHTLGHTFHRTHTYYTKYNGVLEY